MTTLEVSYRNPDGAPLGTQTEVQQAISRIVPQVEFYREPSGAEKIASLAERGLKFPVILHEHLANSPATTQGDADLDGFSLRFFLGAEDLVAEVHVEVRGDGDYRALLQRLADANSWSVEELA